MVKHCFQIPSAIVRISVRISELRSDQENIFGLPDYTEEEFSKEFSNKMRVVEKATQQNACFANKHTTYL